MLRYADANLTLPVNPILQPESVPAWSFGTVSAVCTSSLPYLLFQVWETYSCKLEPMCLLAREQCLAWVPRPRTTDTHAQEAVPLAVMTVCCAA